MSKSLLIVESPAKAKTLKKYLGDDFEVLASYGHVRDLVPKNGAVDPEQDFAMHYEVIERNERHVKAIAKALKKADVLYLATDPDREGEAISWHLYQLLQADGALEGKTVYRVAFHEITPKAVREAVAHPREIAMDLVNAQQARRALDYLVGFNLSPLLWRKIIPGLSAGRVQSPALRMIVEREAEIEAFEPREYWSIAAAFAEYDFSAALVVFEGQKLKTFDIASQAQADAMLATLKARGMHLQVSDVTRKERRCPPAAPFTTSTLQQEAARKLRFSAQRTMRVAQELYESGHITYMRTDSVHLADEALTALRTLISCEYGADYLPQKPQRYTTKSKNAQEAHEAIRPTDCTLAPEAILGAHADALKLYELIRKRAIACQMTPAIFEQVAVTFEAEGADCQFRATGSTLQFPGFMSVYLEDQDDVEGEEAVGTLPELRVGARYAVKNFTASKHVTQPPPRYSEASLIKLLEEKGIGRPSTYASILSTLQTRGYVELKKRRFVPTSIGKIVNTFLTQHFERYVDYDFTAHLEDDLDAVSRGETAWKPLLGHFWQHFSQKLAEKAHISREEIMQVRELGLDPKTGKPVSLRLGRFGPFVQLGSKDDEEKPAFASLPEDCDLEKMTLEEALEFFKLPRTLGQTAEGEEIVINIGRYGPYVRYGRKYVSIPKEANPFALTLDEARALIEAKKALDRQNHIKEIKHGDEILKVLNGRFGPYVTNGSINASIPKKIEPAAVTLEECLELLEKAKVRKKSKRSARSGKAKTSS